jgi:nucleotide-binding universal stress UspA family protein
MMQTKTPETNQKTHILLATDGSKWADGAARVAVAMAAAYHARLTVITMFVLDDQLKPMNVHGTRMDSAKAAEVAKARFANVQALAAEADISCNTEIRYGGSPQQEIVTAAEKLGVDVIVMGRRGERGLAKLFVGDATIKTVSLTDRPVIVVPETATFWQQRILLATDGSEHSLAALEATARFAEISGLPVTVLSVPGSDQIDARQVVDDAARKLQTRGVTVDDRIMEGKPDEVIATAATELGADLVVMGSHGRTGITKLLLGSVSQQVIGALSCAAMVVTKPKK